MSTGEGRIVVGVDRSEAATAALRWALGEAARTGATVEAVHSYDIPVYPGPSIVEVRAMMYASAAAFLRAAVATASAEQPNVTVRRVIRRGPAGPGLVHAAIGARLLVVGTTVRHRVAGLVLGSTAEYCATHAGCPVVAVRPDVARTATAAAPRRLVGASANRDAE